MIFIRADANDKIGAGHVMRCLSIASALLDKGEVVKFIAADSISANLISNFGFECIQLESNYLELESELERLISLLTKNKPLLLLVDSYYVTERYFHELKKYTKLAYFDDLNLKCWDVDYIINYNIFASVFDYSKYSGTNTKLLLTPKYAPLRKEFSNCTRIPQNEFVNVFVSAGGSDPEHIIERIMQQICPDFPNLNFHFVVGSLNPRINEIARFEGGNITIHVDEKNMSLLMGKCDFAISAAGFTLYELCAMGIPTITYTLADNQLPAAEQFDKQGFMINVGDCRDNYSFIVNMKECMFRLINDLLLQSEMSKKMKSLVDGNGVDRIVDVLLQQF